MQTIATLDHHKMPQEKQNSPQLSLISRLHLNFMSSSLNIFYGFLYFIWTMNARKRGGKTNNAPGYCSDLKIQTCLYTPSFGKKSEIYEMDAVSQRL